MKNKTINEIKEIFKTNNLTLEQISQLRQDQRVGVQQIVKKYESQQAELKMQKKRFLKMSTIERKLWQAKNHFVAGVDEAGRGPLAGPVVAAAVILPQDFQLIGINDSKKLKAEELQQYYSFIKQQCIGYRISVVDHHFIDETNILTATKKAMSDALLNLKPQPTYALIDAVTLENIHIPTDTMIKGDEKSISIAAASILAKVSRDKIMQQMHEKYPAYNFHEHKGYGTKKHLQRLENHGVSPIHRQSFAPVKKFIK